MSALHIVRSLFCELRGLELLRGRAKSLDGEARQNDKIATGETPSCENIFGMENEGDKIAS